MILSHISKQNVLVRVGFDIPSLENLSRITSCLPTIANLLQNKNKVILITKWGRPNGADLELSTYKMLQLLEAELNIYLKNNSVAMDSVVENVKICYFNQFNRGFDELKNKIDELPLKSVVLLENIYFEVKEFSNKVQDREDIAKNYASLASYFVDECFISSHRKDATNTEIKKFLPSTVGFHYKQEVFNLKYFLKMPERPFFLVLGGAKLSTKLTLLESLLPKVDKVLLGGTICFPFLNALGKTSLTSIPEEIEIAKKILAKFTEKMVLSENFVPNNALPKDISSETVKIFEKELKFAKSVFWNGPMGQYEEFPYNKGTLKLAEYISGLNAHTVLGGGDSVAAIPESVLNKFTFVSQGGGATLDFLSRG